ncbi:MAG TPA: peptidylprolyl isomerase [Acidobacteriota bacterium]|nr:peptidylprolyl isomerase [Acidobacteriota bacterium]
MRILREPLVHFLAIGAGLFVLSAILGNPGQDRDTEIVVDEGQIQRLVEGWRMTWRRPPTQEELSGLIDDYITEEVLFREALALGLDKGDMMIRRRLRQKMEFISEDFASQLRPTEENLESYLSENAEYFRIDPEITFTHVYLNADRRGETLQRDAERILAELKKGRADAAVVGDPFPLPNDFVAATLTELVKGFGADFAEGVNNLPVGAWEGPVRSGYGFHLVLVRDRREGRNPELDKVKETVIREWTSARRRELNESFIGRLREQYTITLDLPEPDEQSAEAAAESG